MTPKSRNSGGRARRPLLDSGSVIMFPQHTESRRFLSNAYRNISVHMATNLQSTVTARDVRTLLLKMISIRFDLDLCQAEN
jgi:hypothetical protein